MNIDVDMDITDYYKNDSDIEHLYFNPMFTLIIELINKLQLKYKLFHKYNNFFVNKMIVIYYKNIEFNISWTFNWNNSYVSKIINQQKQKDKYLKELVNIYRKQLEYKDSFCELISGVKLNENENQYQHQHQHQHENITIQIKNYTYLKYNIMNILINESKKDYRIKIQAANMIKKHWKKCRYNPKYKMCENVQTNNLKEIIEGYILP